MWREQHRSGVGLAVKTYCQPSNSWMKLLYQLHENFQPKKNYWLYEQVSCTLLMGEVLIMFCSYLSYQNGTWFKSLCQCLIVFLLFGHAFLPLSEHPWPEDHTAGVERRRVHSVGPVDRTVSEFHRVVEQTPMPCPGEKPEEGEDF